MNNEEKLIEAAEKLASNTRGFEARTLERIGNRIKKTGYLNSADEKALQNMLNIGVDLDEIYADLARTTEMNIKEVQAIMTDVMTEEVKQSQALYKATGTPFIPYGENAYAQQLVKNWTVSTASEMINLSRTSSIGFTDTKGTFHNIEDSFYNAMDKAVVSVRSGVTDFPTAMRDVVNDLGGSGVVVNYGSGVHRSLDNVVRQNLLWGCKKSSQDYMSYVGEQISADGYEIDSHSGCRPTHRAIQGLIVAKGHESVTIDGVTYPSEYEDLDGNGGAIDLLQDYGCLHFATPFLLGISQPRYDKQTLQQIQEETERVREYEGKQGDLYFWKQKQRELERLIRAEKREQIINKASGFNDEAKKHKDNVIAYRKKYDEMCEKVGLTKTLERATVSGYKG